MPQGRVDADDPESETKTIGDLPKPGYGCGTQ